MDQIDAPARAGQAEPVRVGQAGEDRPEEAKQEPAKGRVLTVFGRRFTLPGSRRSRIVLGTGLSIAGLFGFLPVLGFWMVPLGLLILSHELHVLRRTRRRWAVWRERRRRTGAQRRR